MSNNCKTVVIVPFHTGKVNSTIEIVISPGKDKVLVLELFDYEDFEYVGIENDHGRLPSHMVNGVFEFPAYAEELIKEFKIYNFIEDEVDVMTPLKCIVHAAHLLDEEPIVCPNFGSALDVAKALANHNA